MDKKPESPFNQTNRPAASKLSSGPNFNEWDLGSARYQLIKLLGNMLLYIWILIIYIYSYISLGKGSYGLVAEATDNKIGSQVAIKQMKSIFDEPTDAKRAYREIHILRCDR